MKILLLAGEESGKIYANRLRGLLKHHDVRGYEDYGFKTADLAVMGFVAVLARLPYFIRVNKTMKTAILKWQPDVIVTIDYPGMNLKLAAFAKAHGVRAIHVVCPQVWAWKAGRIPKIEASLDELCCFFPFEPSLFRPGFATFVGHPLVETFEENKSKSLREENLLAILPGSRIGEIKRNFPLMLDAFRRLDGIRAVVPAANETARSCIEQILKNKNVQNLTIQNGGARDLLLRATCAIVASGTATLEASLARCPTVLVYKVSAALAWFARKVIKGVRHLGLVNIVWDKMHIPGDAPMPELLQEDFTPENLKKNISEWFSDSAKREIAAKRLEKSVGILKSNNSAFQKILEIILKH